MSELFDFEAGERHHDDVFTVMGRAIRDHFSSDEDKITPAMARTMAKIIDEGFLNGVLSEQSALIQYAKKSMEENTRKARQIEEEINRLACRYRALERDVELQQDRLEKYRKIEQEETDPLLVGAKKAFSFILDETYDRDKAFRAFNSYLRAYGNNVQDIPDPNLGTDIEPQPIEKKFSF